MPLRIFISYSTSDITSASAIADRLKQEEREVYLAEVSAKTGVVLSAELEANIKACDLFIVLWSKNAKKSDWVSQEIGTAKGAGHEILPVILQEGLSAPGFISDRKYLPAYKGFEQALEHLSKEVGHHADIKTKREKEKEANNGLALLGIGALILLALSK